MSEENKRTFGDREEEAIQEREEMLKRFEGKNDFRSLIHV